MQARLFIHAINVHQGGGRTLLDGILKLSPAQSTIALLDERMPLPEGISSSILIVRVKPSVAGRLQSERLLASEVNAGDTVLCFGNLPPLFTVPGRVVVFVQNRYLIEEVSLDRLSIKSRMRLRLERKWFLGRARSVDEYVVQTPSMKTVLETYLEKVKTKSGFRIRMLPFMSSDVQVVTGSERGAAVHPLAYDFVYVGSGESHKNHRRLIEAWILLAKDGHYPSLSLTIDATGFPALCNWIELQTRRYNLRVDNRGALPYSGIKDLYNCSTALIYPSTLESFGLPLIEAKNAGLAILAGELDYVRDVADPDQTFDPTSAVSIARAVKRFQRIEEQSLTIIDASTFVDSLIQTRASHPVPINEINSFL